MYYTIGGFTLDDTVLPSGEVRWKAPGGNVLYSAIGAKIWDDNVGMISPVGRDYPQEYLEIMEEKGLDIEGVRRIDHPSFHVWILHEGNGRRQIIYRLDSGSNKYLDPTVEDIPEDCLHAQGVHICPILNDSQQKLMEYLFEKDVPVFLDLIVIPGQIDVEKLRGQDNWKKLRAFLPSIEEVRTVFGDLPLEKLLARVEESGPPCFAIKIGHHGSVVRNPADKSYYHVPVYKADVLDATGAGDSYCGGFMVGLQEAGDAVKAAMYGTVSSSFLIEDFGALHGLDVTTEMARERLADVEERVSLLDAKKLNQLDQKIMSER